MHLSVHDVAVLQLLILGGSIVSCIFYLSTEVGNMYYLWIGSCITLVVVAQTIDLTMLENEFLSNWRQW